MVWGLASWAESSASVWAQLFPDKSWGQWVRGEPPRKASRESCICLGSYQQGLCLAGQETDMIGCVLG